MSIFPWYIGATLPVLQISLSTDAEPDAITGLVSSNFAMLIRNTGTGSDTSGTGTFVVLSATPAIISYQLSSADVATAGSYQLIVKATFPTGTKIYDPLSFTLTAI